MFINNLKIAYRHLKANKTFTIINIVGLSVSTSAFVLITLYVSFELSFDQFHANKDFIYRVGLHRYAGGELVETSVKTFPGVRSLLKDNFPEVQDVTGFYKTPANTGFLFRHNGTIHNEAGGEVNADSAFFRVFPTLLLRGNANTVLSQPNSLILTERLAKKLFGDKDPIGQTLDRIDDRADGSNFTVRGVMRDIPGNAHFHATVVEQVRDSWPESDVELWGEGRMWTYVNFSKSVDKQAIEDKLNALLRNLEKENPLVKDTKIFIQHITDIHLTSGLKDELEANGNKSLLYLLGTIGLIILIIAWINYVNLETSRFVVRIKQFGIRMAIGSGRRNLALQFLTEYLLLTICALTLSSIILVLALPYYAELTGVQLQGVSLVVCYAAVAIFLLGSISVSVYPALFLMKFNPVSALKGRVGQSKSGGWIRQALVVLQFTTSIVLIALVLTVNSQLDFMKLINKGIELESVIAVRNATAYSGQELTAKHGEFETLRNKLMEYPAVRSVASSSAIPGSEIGFSYVNLIKRNMGDPYDPTTYKTMFVSADFIPTYNMHLLAGETFSAPLDFKGESPWDTNNWSSIILNEKAIQQLGFNSATDALNQEVFFEPFDGFLKCRIIGVIKDYYHEAAKEAVLPIILFHNYSTFQQVYFSIGLNAGSNPQESLKQIEKAWKESFPDRPFEYFFLDEYYDQQFKNEVRFQSIFSLFAGIAIVIACLGVLGMTLFEMNSRLKEISIRKLLGASIFGLVMLLSRANIRVISISSLLAVPLIYYLSREWLSNYPERIEFTPWLTLVPLMAVALTVMLVSGIQTVTAAESNPIDHLKSE